MKKMGTVIARHWISLTLLIVGSLLALRPLFYPGLFTAHDIWHQVARLYHYSDALRDGQFLPSWIGTLSLGYGYPLFLFSYHLPWMFAAPFVLAGLDLFVSLKLVFAIGVILSSLSMYLLSYIFTRSRIASLTSGLMYVYAPSHFLSVYVSASIGTVFAFWCLPLIVLGLYLVLEKRQHLLGSYFFAFGSAALILSHLMTAVMIFGVISILGVIWLTLKLSSRNIADRGLFKTILALTFGVCLTFGLTAFYLIPLFFSLDAIQSNQQGSGLYGLYERNFPALRQLIYSKWGFGPIVENAKDGEISFQVGVAQWFSVVLLGLVVCWQTFKRSSKSSRFARVILIGFVLSIVFMLDISNPLWRAVNEVVSLDYPYRLLLLAVFFGSTAGAQLIALTRTRLLRTVFALIFLMIAVYTNRNHIRVNQYTDIPLSLYLSSELTTNTFHEYAPKGVTVTNLKFDAPLALPTTPLLSSFTRDVLVSTTSAQINLSAAIQNTQSLSMDIDVASAGAVSFRQFAFPGQTLFINGLQREYQKDPNGLITTFLEKGSYQVSIRYIWPWYFWVGYLSTLAYLLTLSIFHILTQIIFRQKNI